MGTAPLGIEIRQSAYELLRGGAIDNTMFLRLRIANLGGNTLDSLWIGYWSDPDLGGPSDDLVGSDSARALVYCYNGRYQDWTYGTTPPAMGFTLLRGLTPNGGAPLGPYAL